MTGTNGIAIQISNLSKMFKMYAKPSDMFWELLTGKERHRPFWALKDVSFEVPRGQVVGIMGRNGAGKSTLLKIIAGTLDLTSGAVSVQGRVSSILELGTGFNGEYSGRENIYLGGLMVGLAREEILSKMDWIIQFSEIEEFIDQPFKTYSTGMQARLTFSTAVCVDPDILIIDEALSVGDARFQRKSFGKIEEFRKAGRTILLVSHDSNTIATFCDHAILLENGKVFDQGEPQRISKVYYKMLFSGDSPVQSLRSVPAHEGTALAVGEQEIMLDCNKMAPERGYGWRLDLSSYDILGDSAENPQQSQYALYENEKPLYPGHHAHDLIRQYGKGGYSHWGTSLYFSTSDNSDPRNNGRAYRMRHVSLSFESQEMQVQGSNRPTDREILRRRALEKLGCTENLSRPSQRQSRMGNGKAEIIDFGIRDGKGRAKSLLNSGSKYTLFMKVLFYEDLDAVIPGFLIRNVKGVDLFGTTPEMQGSSIHGWSRGDLVEVSVEVIMWLTNGIYFLTLGLADANAETDVQYDLRYDAFQFEVSRKSGIFQTSIVDLDAHPIEEHLLEHFGDHN